MGFDSCNHILKFWESNSQSESSLGSVGVQSLALSHTVENMKCDSQASLLAHTFTRPCLDRKPKVKVTTLVTLVKNRKRQWSHRSSSSSPPPYFHSSQTRRQWHKPIVFVFFFWPLSLLSKTKYDDDFWSSSSLPPLPIITLFRHEDDNTKFSFSCHFLFWPSSFLWKTKYDVDVWSSSSSPLVFAPLRHKDNNTWSLFSYFFFFPSSFLWKQKTTTICDHCHLCLILFLFLLDTKDNIRKSSSSCFFLFGLCRSYERQKMTTIYDCHRLCVLLLLSLFLNMKTTTQSCHLCVFFLLVFFVLVKGRRWRWFVIVIIFTSSCSHFS